MGLRPTKDDEKHAAANMGRMDGEEKACFSTERIVDFLGNLLGCSVA